MNQRIVETNKNPHSPLMIAVVLTWNDTDMAARCIESVLGNDYKNKQLILVDNGSEPPRCAILKESFPSITTIQLSENTGFAGGCNRGIEKALVMGADYVFLLNNDTIVHKNAISILIRELEKRQDAAFACPLILLPGKEKRVAFYTATVNRNIARHIHEYQGELYQGKPVEKRFRKTVETEFAMACALLYRADALRQVGLFDETYFTNNEDYDHNMRLTDAGWKLLTVGEAEVIHSHAQTTGTISPFITYLHTRNRLISLFRYGTPKGILLNFPLLLRTFVWQIKRHGLTNWGAHMAFLKGIFAFILGIRGKRGVPSNRKDHTRK